MRELFHEILYRPLFNALVFLYERVTFEDLGFAIILLTIGIRLILYPLFYKSFKHQTILQRLQPEVKKIQSTHHHSREKQAEALLALYRENRVNPFSGFFLILIQLPILIALYRVFLNGFTPDALPNLYSFIDPPEMIKNSFLGLIDLSRRSIVVVGIAAAAQYLQVRLGTRPRGAQGGGESSAAEQIGRYMPLITPFITVVFLFSLPSAIGIYWATTSLFSAFQQMVVNRVVNRDDRKLPEKDKATH